VAGDRADVVEREHVRRVGHRDDELAVLPPDRDRLVAAGDRLADEADRRRVDARVGEVEILEPDLLGERADEVGLGDRPRLDEDAAELFARPRLLVQAASSWASVRRPSRISSAPSGVPSDRTASSGPRPVSA
jgi:hypothetical protein